MFQSLLMDQQVQVIHLLSSYTVNHILDISVWFTCAKDTCTLVFQGHNDFGLYICHSVRGKSFTTRAVLPDWGPFTCPLPLGNVFFLNRVFSPDLILVTFHTFCNEIFSKYGGQSPSPTQKYMPWNQRHSNIHTNEFRFKGITMTYLIPRHSTCISTFQ